ncbi:sensor histidine kinase [Bacteroidota bacterium]
MGRKLVISVCNFLIPEVAQVIKDGNYQDVKPEGFKASCFIKNIAGSEKTGIKSKKDDSDSDKIIISGLCHHPEKENIEKNNNHKLVQLEQCFELFINKETVLHFINSGYYIVTTGWLRTYKEHIRSWGFDPDSAKTFFGESMKSILFLDTKISGDYLSNLKALSEYMGLPYEILPVGLSHCKSFIDTLITDWRIENERKLMNEKLSAVSRQSADYSVIFNQLESLVNLTDETKIIEVGFELLNLLFAPSKIKYTRILNKKEENFEFKGVFDNQQQNEDDIFKIEVHHSNELLGIFEICDIKFPQFKSQYEKMGVLISQIFGLSIANARKYRITLEQREQLEIYSGELQEINQTKDKFFSIIAHDLRGPFSSLIGFSELLMLQIQKGNFNNIEKYSSLIRQISNQTYNFLVNLLEWSRSQTGRLEFEPESFILSDLTNEIVGLLKYQADMKSNSIKQTISPDLEVFGDKNMLKTVMLNLVTNAIKYTKGGGVITLSASYKNGINQISVSDTGIGISMEDMGKLFQLEHTSSKLGTNNEKGTGLGLILCKEFIEKHKGKIWVESEVNKGSVFHFTLPSKNYVSGS